MNWKRVISSDSTSADSWSFLSLFFLCILYYITYFSSNILSFLLWTSLKNYDILWVLWRTTILNSSHHIVEDPWLSNAKKYQWTDHWLYELEWRTIEQNITYIVVVVRNLKIQPKSEVLVWIFPFENWLRFMSCCSLPQHFHWQWLSRKKPSLLRLLVNIYFPFLLWWLIKSLGLVSTET